MGKQGWWRGLVLCLALGTGLCSSVALAQDPRLQLRSAVLVVDSDALFRTSAFGQRVAAEIATEFARLEEENRRIEAELEQEELDLTEQRATLSGDEFRTVAEAFDEKVRAVRREQLLKARELQRREGEIPPEFLSAAAPVLEAMMIEAGAVVVLERRNVLLSRNLIDITSEAVARINANFGAGAVLDDDPLTPGTAPGTGPDPEAADPDPAD